MPEPADLVVSTVRYLSGVDRTQRQLTASINNLRQWIGSARPSTLNRDEEQLMRSTVELVQILARSIEQVVLIHDQVNVRPKLAEFIFRRSHIEFQANAERIRSILLGLITMSRTYKGRAKP